MNKAERSKKLQELLVRIPIHPNFFDELRFTGWQGQVSGLLSFDKKLQSDFQGAVNSIDNRGTMMQKLPSAQRAGVTMRNIMYQAIGELDIPEEPLRETSQTEMKLADEHDGWWFVCNSTNRVRWKLAAVVCSAILTIFLVGVGVGQIDLVRSLYIQFRSPQMPQPINPPTKPQPTTQPSSANSPVKK